MQLTEKQTAPRKNAVAGLCMECERCRVASRRIVHSMHHYTVFKAHPTFYVLPPLLRVFLEAESVVVAEPEVFALVFSVAAGPSP